MMSSHWNWQNGRLPAIIGIILTLPAFLLLGGGLLFSLGLAQFNNALEQIGFFEMTHPVIILGGAAAGVLLNLLPVMRVKREEGMIVNTIILKQRGLNWGYLMVTAVSLGLIFLYLLAENFQLF